LVLFLRRTITPNTRTPRAPATARIIRDVPIAILLSRLAPKLNVILSATIDQADFDFLLRRMMTTPTTTAIVSATTRTIRDDSIANLLSGAPGGDWRKRFEADSGIP